MTDKKFEFIKNLTESKLIRHKAMLSKYDARDIADMIFLYMLAIQVLKSDFNAAPFGLAYLHKTFVANRIDDFRHSSSDLNLLAHTLFGANNTDSYETLKNKDSNDILMNQINFDYNMVRRWSRMSIQGSDTTSLDYRLLLKLEQDLKITNSNFRAIRRLVSDWNNIPNESQQLAMTRLILEFRKLMPQAEIMRVLEKFARSKKLMIKDNSNLAKNLAIMSAGAIAGAAIVRFLRGDRFKSHKQKKNLRLGEMASGGATAAGAIAAVPMPLGTVQSRTGSVDNSDTEKTQKKSKKSKKKSKKPD